MKSALGFFVSGRAEAASARQRSATARRFMAHGAANLKTGNGESRKKAQKTQERDLARSSSPLGKMRDVEAHSFVPLVPFCGYPFPLFRLNGGKKRAAYFAGISFSV